MPILNNPRIPCVGVGWGSSVRLDDDFDDFGGFRARAKITIFGEGSRGTGGNPGGEEGAAMGPGGALAGFGHS